VASFLLESYTPECEPAVLDQLTARAREAAEEALREGLQVRHVRSFLAPEDSICFHLFEAPSAEVIVHVSEIASFDYQRITEVIE